MNQTRKGLPAFVFTLLGCLVTAASLFFVASAQDMTEVGMGATGIPLDITAKAMIQSCETWPRRLGFAFLRERPSEEGVKQVDVFMRIHRPGLEPGKHAVHIHETAVCQPCSAARGHFDPGLHGNTSPDGNHPFHSGDLTNITLNEEGMGSFLIQTSRITLSDGPLSLFDEDGSAFIVHVDPDTYCPEGEEAGCAGGSRAACGVIEPE